MRIILVRIIFVINIFNDIINRETLSIFFECY
jgi:hypothetical protein